MARQNQLQTVTGKRIGPRDVERGIRLNYVAGALSMVFVAAVMGMPLTMLLEALGAGGVLLGMVGTFNNLALSMQIPGAWFAQRLRQRKVYWFWTTIIHRLMWIIPAFIPFWLTDNPVRAAQWVVIIAASSAFLANASASSWHSWMADLIPEKMRSRFWGQRQSVVMAMFMVAVVASGYVLDLFEGKDYRGFFLVFLVCALAGALDIVIHYFVPEPAPKASESPISIWLQFLEPMKNKDFRRLTLAMGFWFFGISFFGPYTQVYLKRVFHVSYSHLSLLAVVASLSTIIFSYIWSYLMDRVGVRVFGALMAFTGPCLGIVWFFLGDYPVTLWGDISLPQPVFLVLLSGIVSGGFYGGVGLCQLNLASALAPEAERTPFMAIHWTLVGLLGAAGAMLGGVVMDILEKHPLPITLPFGQSMTYVHVQLLVHVAASWLLVAPLLLRISKQVGDLTFSSAFSRLFLTNPFRTVSSIYHMRIIGSASTRKSRVKSLRSLGTRKAAIAVADLIKQLEDPASEVREEAAYALSAIGSPESVDALIRKMEDPHSDLAPQIARALRNTKAPQTVEALLKKMEGDSDEETKRESARTLGMIGDRRATGGLMKLLQNAQSPGLVSASSEALARLGEIMAIYEIIPRMKSTQNPVLKRSLAVAVGDLLGKPDGFYKLLVRESEDYGIEVERLLDKFRNQIKGATRKNLVEEGKWLQEKSRELEHAYIHEEIAQCADILFDMAIAFSALLYGVSFGGNAKALVDELVWRDQRFSVGIWYLHLLRENWEGADFGDRDYVDVLLGIYFLSSVRFPD